ncbi:MAG: hypothetical protein AAB865_01725, partial [Patescibacteria group bacterium]
GELATETDETGETTSPEGGLMIWSYGSGTYTVTPGYRWATLGAVAMCSNERGMITFPSLEVEGWASYDPANGDPYTLGIAVNTTGDDSVTFSDRFDSCELSGIDGGGTIEVPGTLVGDRIEFDIATALERHAVVRDSCGGSYYTVLEVHCDVNSEATHGGVANGYAINIPDDGGVSPMSTGIPVGVTVGFQNIADDGTATKDIWVAAE